MKVKVSLLAWALLIAACGSRGDRWEKELAPVGPVVAGEQLVWLVSGTSRVVGIDPARGEPVSLYAGDVPRAIAAVEGGVAVLGGRGDDPRLHRIAVPRGERFSIPLPAAYDRIAVAPGGKLALLFFDPNATPAPGSPAARNYNEVAVVDLAAGTARAVALGTESLAPRSVIFPPAGDLAAVILDAAVALVDLANPATHLRIPLKLGNGAELTTEEALFAPDGAFLYVRTAQSNDVLAIELHRQGGALDASINFLFVTASGAPSLEDIVVPEGTGFERSVAAVYRVGDGSLAALLDATGDVSKSHVASLSRPANHIDDLGGGRLLLYPDASVASRGVAGWEPLTDRFDEDVLPGTPADLPRFGGGAAFFAHNSVKLTGRSATPALALVTLAEENSRLRIRIAPLGLAFPAVATAVVPENGLFFAGVDVLREGSGAAPAVDDAEDFSGLTGSLVAVGGAAAIDGAVLDDRIVDLAVGAGHIWAFHDSYTGDVTVLPVGDLRRGAARRFDGFLLTGALEGKR